MLSPGTQIGSYQVVALLGAGGMGEVYRARDTRLNREVALKVLPEAFSRDFERMARFEREAKLLASLNHPNIAAIYGLEESGPIRALVMELVEGSTLAERIRSGPIPPDEALPIARQVADAVGYAHDKSVIHRDLKPANIKVTAEGAVKVLDFGLAKAMSEELSEADMGNSPTLSMAATRQGVILGTAAYMAPEQVKGKSVDRRADVWAFGVVFYEMLAGRQLFSGDSIAETLASVMKEAPSFDVLPPATPAPVRNLLRRCLEKDPRRRLMHIGEARILLEDVLSGNVASHAAPVAAAPRKSREKIAWATTAALVIAALGWAGFAFLRPAPEAARPVRFSIYPPDSWSLSILPSGTGALPAPLAVSPDGLRIAFLAGNSEGRSLLWVRSLDTLAARSLEGTDGATSPFWSPDSRFLGFFADGKLKKIDTSGGPPVTLCDASVPSGGTWSQDGTILFAPTQNSTLQKVSAAGGAPVAVTTLAEGEVGHWRPFFLPDGRHFIYRVAAGMTGGPVYLASLDSPERTLLINSDSSNVLYAQGHLLFLRETTLMAQPFDPQRLALAGDPVPIAEQIQLIGVGLLGVFSASANGLLVYQTGTGAVGSRLAWYDRAGKQVASVGDVASYGDLELASDSKHASVSLPMTGARDIWLFDLERGLRTRFTFDSAAELESIWSPDGSHVVFNSTRTGFYDLYQKPATGAGADEILFEDKTNKYPLSWSPDGRWILFRAVSGPTGNDLFVLPLTSDKKPIPFLNTQFNEIFGQFSPDGRWIAYSSNESGRNEVYVASFPGPGGKWQVSTAGGEYPRWRRDGAELFFFSTDYKLMAAAVNARGSDFQVGAVDPLFQARPVIGFRYPYGVSPDGQRFLINTLPERSASPPLTAVLNWTAGLPK
jgi:Tol biopolymer transport system component